jgi:hypothetical protein
VACEVEDAYRACEVRMAAEVEDAYKAAFRAYVCACACACRRLGLRFGVCHLIPCLVQTHILRWVVPDFVRPSLLPCLPPSLYRSVFVENKRSKVVSSIRQNVRAVSLSLGVYLCVCVCVCVLRHVRASMVYVYMTSSRYGRTIYLNAASTGSAPSGVRVCICVCLVEHDSSCSP